MKRVAYFERMSNVDLFSQTLTQDGDITLTRVDRDMPDAELMPIMSTTHGYQTRGGGRGIPPKFQIDKDFIAMCPNLLAVCTGGAGYDVINVADCTEAGVVVANQAGLNAEAVAEHAVAMMLSLTKNLAVMDKIMRRVPDMDRFAYRAHDMFGKTLGVVGLGQIGARAAEICKAGFSMDVLAVHPRLTPEQAAERHARLVELPELLEKADFVLVACGLNDETRGMFGTEEFAAMKPTAFFVTIGRGGIHDEDALAQALAGQHIAGAGLDVWIQEPPPLDHPLLKFDNVIASPHAAALTHESARKAMTGSAMQWRQILNCELPPRLINKEVWPKFQARYKEVMSRT